MTERMRNQGKLKLSRPLTSEHRRLHAPRQTQKLHAPPRLPPDTAKEKDTRRTSRKPKPTKPYVRLVEGFTSNETPRQMGESSNTTPHRRRTRQIQVGSNYTNLQVFLKPSKKGISQADLKIGIPFQRNPKSRPSMARNRNRHRSTSFTGSRNTSLWPEI